MATKISDLPSDSSPATTAEIPIVESSTTKKTTVGDLTSTVLDSRLGWFDTGHNGSDQTGIGTSEVQLLVDNLNANMGGYAYLPTGVVEADVYDSSDSRLKTDWLSTGQMVLLRITGTATTSSANTGLTVTVKFFDSADTEIFSLSDFVLYAKGAGAHAFNSVYPLYISSTLATSGSYCKVYATFDTGGSNEMDMGGFTLAVIK